MGTRGAHRRPSRKRPVPLIMLAAAAVVAVVLVLVGLPGSGDDPVSPAAAPGPSPTPGPTTATPGSRPAPPVVQARIDQIAAARPLLFVGNGTAMTPDGAVAVDQLATVLLTAPPMTVTVTGHTAPVDGDPAWCQRLSELRADLVARRLESYGIAPDRLRTRGVSHMYPAPTWEASRRVELSTATA